MVSSIWLLGLAQFPHGPDNSRGQGSPAFLMACFVLWERRGQDCSKFLTFCRMKKRASSDARFFDVYEILTGRGGRFVDWSHGGFVRPYS